MKTSRCIEYKEGADKLGKAEFLNSWFYQRTIDKNQNVLLAFTGSTGSGKTYSAMSAAEHWYNKKFPQEFPVENVCFSLSELALRISTLKKSGKLRKGELFILEEAGANFGNMEFQNKLNKMFGYILQSFRSMNLIVLMTLPVLTMLNKSARQLIHGNFMTAGIDYNLKLTKVKPMFHQLNQRTGKSYWKYARVKIHGRVKPMQRLSFDLPSKRLIELYEKKKEEFVFKLTDDFVEQSGVSVEKVNEKDIEKSIKKKLSLLETAVLNRINQGMTAQEIADGRGCSIGMIYKVMGRIYMKGYEIRKGIESIAPTLKTGTPTT